MRPRPILAFAAFTTLAVLLAGCGLPVALPEAQTPKEPGHPWTDPDGALWVARKSACSDCGSGADQGNLGLTLLYRDGSVLHAVYGEGGPEQVEGYPAAEGNRRGLTFVFPDEHEPYRDELTEAWTVMTGAEPDRVRVHQLHALALDPSEREDQLRVVEHALRSTETLAAQGPPADDPGLTEDGILVAYWTLGRPQEFRGPHGGVAPDEGWTLLERQMFALRDWVTGTE